VKILLLIITALTLSNANEDTLVKSMHHITASMVFKTADLRTAEVALCTTVEELGGWLLNSNQQELWLRVPQKSVDAFIGKVDSMGVTTDVTYNRSDVTSAYQLLAASLQAKTYLLGQYLDLLDSSGTEGIYPVAREVADLQNKIEMVKGQIHGMTERMNYAEIRIYFTFNDRRAPLVSGYSDFEWLNTVNLPALLEDFK